MHGFNGGPGDWAALRQRLLQAHPGQQVIEVPLFSAGASWTACWNQTPALVQWVRNATRGMAAYHLVCHSQGGILCRAVLETMDDHRVANFVSLAGVQQGVDSFNMTILPSWLRPWLKDGVDLAYKLLYTPLGQASLSFAGYWNDAKHHAQYLAGNEFLAHLDNDPNATAAIPAASGAGTAASRKANFLRVKAAHFFASPGDGTVFPWQSEIFSFWDETGATMVPMRQRALYTQDWFGLRSLDERGGLHLTTVPGVQHSQWLHRADLFETYLEPLLR